MLNLIFLSIHIKQVSETCKLVWKIENKNIYKNKILQVAFFFSIKLLIFLLFEHLLELHSMNQ